MKCRFCRADVQLEVLNLGSHPPSNSYVSQSSLGTVEPAYPLKVRVCEICWLVQTEDFVESATLFDSNYAYFSGASSGWSTHVEEFARTAIREFGLHEGSFVVEIASNDGSLLRNFVGGRIPCLGIEPTSSTAAVARLQGVETVEEFFGAELGRELRVAGRAADLVIANNVLAHVPDILDFATGVERLLKDEGVASFEFPHLVNLLRHNQFDTVYHEHFSYLSVTASRAVFEAAGLKVWRVQELSTHGGSVRVSVCKQSSGRKVEDSVDQALEREHFFGITSRDTYLGLQPQADRIAGEFKDFIRQEIRSGRRVAGLGAAAKGNTLINFSGVTNEEILVIFDSAPSKQGLLTPGAHIPIQPVADIVDFAPDTVVIFPWNIREELEGELGRFGLSDVRVCTAVPELRLTN